MSSNPNPIQKEASRVLSDSTRVGGYCRRCDFRGTRSVACDTGVGPGATEPISGQGVHSGTDRGLLQAYPACRVIQRATARAMLAMPGALTLAGQRSLAA